MVAEVLPGGGTVHLSYGEEQMDEYVHQIAADHLIHAWDLAVATGTDPRLDPHLVGDVAAWFAEREPLYRGAGAIGAARVSRTAVRRQTCSRPSGATPPGAPTTPAWRLSPPPSDGGDTDAIMALMTDDCVFEATGPPAGRRPARGVERRTGPVAAAVRWHPRAGLHRGGDLRRRRPRGAAVAFLLGGRRRLPGPRARRRRPPLPRGEGLREALLRQGLTPARRACPT